jgi:hypothetical protein
MRVTSILFLLSATVGCTDAENTNTNEEGEVSSYSLSILSPEQDAQFEPGELVTLSVAVVSNTGDSISLEQVTWETGDWLANGNNLSVTDLPEGSRSLNVTAVAMGDSFSGSVDIHIGDDGSGDTGDPGGTGDFSGVVEALIQLQLKASSGGTTYEDPCEGWVDFNIEDGVLYGEGSCRAFGEDWDFGMEGNETGSTLSGSLTMEFEDVEPEPTAFTGSRDELDHIALEFSGTHHPGEVSGVAIEYLTITGTITADPELD